MKKIGKGFAYYRNTNIVSVFSSIAAYANVSQSLSTQGWFIGLMCAVALLTLLMLVGCFVQINRGGKYAGTVTLCRLQPRCSFSAIAKTLNFY